MAPKKVKGSKPKDMDKSSWAPLLISIGPQCCGKSTFLNSFEGIQVIEMDNVPQVYEKVSVSGVFEHLQSRSGEGFVDRKVYGTSLSERVQMLESSEQIQLAYLFSGKLSYEEFAVKCAQFQYSEEELSVFLETVQELIRAGLTMKSGTIDIFVPEALKYAAQVTLDNLRQALRINMGLVAFGNTNLNTQHYAEALYAAYLNKRRVRFVRWGQEMPLVSTQELLKRDIKRYLETGRYIPFSTLLRCAATATALMTQAGGAVCGLPKHSGLAKIAGYKMKADGYVKQDKGKNISKVIAASFSSSSSSTAPPPALTRAASDSGPAEGEEGEEEGAGNTHWSSWGDDAVIITGKYVPFEEEEEQEEDETEQCAVVVLEKEPQAEGDAVSSRQGVEGEGVIGSPIDSSEEQLDQADKRGGAAENDDERVVHSKQNGEIEQDQQEDDVDFAEDEQVEEQEEEAEQGRRTARTNSREAASISSTKESSEDCNSFMCLWRLVTFA